MKSGKLFDDLPDWIPREAWNGWLEMRVAKKVPNTDRALRVALGKLDALRSSGEDPEKVIDQSTERGWTSFFPYRDPLSAASGKQAQLEKNIASAGERWLSDKGRRH